MKRKFGEILKTMGIAVVIVVCATIVSVAVVALVNWLKPLCGEYVLYSIIGVSLLGAVFYIVYDIRKSNEAFNKNHEYIADTDNSGAVSGAVSNDADSCPIENESPEKSAERKFHKMCGVDESKLRPFGDLNYVVQAWVSDDGKTATCDNYMPRKNRVECCQFESRDELCKDLADTKERMKMAMVLIDKFIAGEINNFYYWDETSMPDGWMDENKSETKENE